MTKLPERNLLDGSKTPKTTTGEIKDALGELRDFVNALLGDDSDDQESARQSLGIDLKALARQIDAKADREAVTAVVESKADRMELEEVKQSIQEEIARQGAPVGTVAYFAMATPPAGYLKADGSAVGRETYPELFGAIGTVYGEGDGTTTFNLPDLMGRFAEGSTTPGTAKAAGLPNVTGLHSVAVWAYESLNPSGCFCKGNVYSQKIEGGTGTYQNLPNLVFDASRSNPVYGASTTVQPSALTLLPCIKAFDAVTNSGLIDVTELAQEMAGKLDRIVHDTTVKYVTDTFRDGTYWYRRWSDGWIEQGSTRFPMSDNQTVQLLLPFASADYSVVVTVAVNAGAGGTDGSTKIRERNTAYFVATGGRAIGTNDCIWYAFGQGV